jgi:hypothetical protein
MGVDLIVLQQLAVSFGLGLLLGLQRERAESAIGGSGLLEPRSGENVLNKCLLKHAFGTETSRCFDSGP